MKNQKRVPSSVSPSVSSPAASVSQIETIETWIQTNRNYALRIALNIVRTREEAEDAVAEASLRAIRSAHTYNPKQSMRSWFSHIVTMVCYEWLRAAKAMKRPQTVSFSDIVLHGRGNEGEGYHPVLDAPDPCVDVARDATGKVAAASVGILTGEGIGEAGDLPDWLLDGLRAVPEGDRSLLMDVYVLQKPRKVAASARGLTEHGFGQRLRRAQASLRAVCGLPGGLVEGAIL